MKRSEIHRQAEWFVKSSQLSAISSQQEGESLNGYRKVLEEFDGILAERLGVCLADHRHRWTGPQRERFERSERIIRRVKRQEQ